MIRTQRCQVTSGTPMIIHDFLPSLGLYKMVQS